MQAVIAYKTRPQPPAFKREPEASRKEPIMVAWRWGFSSRSVSCGAFPPRHFPQKGPPATARARLGVSRIAGAAAARLPSEAPGKTPRARVQCNCARTDGQGRTAGTRKYHDCGNMGETIRSARLFRNPSSSIDRLPWTDPIDGFPSRSRGRVAVARSCKSAKRAWKRSAFLVLARGTGATALPKSELDRLGRSAPVASPRL